MAEAPEIRSRDGAHAGGARGICICGGNKPEGIQVPQYQEGTETKGNWGQCADRGIHGESMVLCVPTTTDNHLQDTAQGRKCGVLYHPDCALKLMPGKADQEQRLNKAKGIKEVFIKRIHLGQCRSLAGATPKSNPRWILVMSFILL